MTGAVELQKLLWAVEVSTKNSYGWLKKKREEEAEEVRRLRKFSLGQRPRAEFSSVCYVA